MAENEMVGLSVLSSWRYVFISQKAYQESETRPESSVYTRMKGVAVHGDDILDTVEYARPSEVSQSGGSGKQSHICMFCQWKAFILFLQGGDVISTILRREVTYDQTQGTCAEVRQENIATRITLSLCKYLTHNWTPVWLHYSILKCPMPTAQQILTVFRDWLTLTAMVILFFVKSCLCLHTSYMPIVYSRTVQNLPSSLCYR